MDPQERRLPDKPGWWWAKKLPTDGREAEVVEVKPVGFDYDRNCWSHQWHVLQAGGMNTLPLEAFEWLGPATTPADYLALAERLKELEAVIRPFAAELQHWNADPVPETLRLPLGINVTQEQWEALARAGAEKK